MKRYMVDTESHCKLYPRYYGCNAFRNPTNADRIRSMSDEELSEFLTHMNPTNCQDCAFSHGWRCQPDRDDYSDLRNAKRVERDGSSSQRRMTNDIHNSIHLGLHSIFNSRNCKGDG